MSYITSYNEHYEGTSIEPGYNYGISGKFYYGDEYLKMIKNTFSGIPVLAHYVSWHDVPGGWAWTGSYPDRRDNPVGGYSSKNLDIIAQHNLEMEAYGINPMVSWWGKDTYAGDAFLDVYLPTRGPKAAILYEATDPSRMRVIDGTINMSDSRNIDIFSNDMQHLQEKYFSRYKDRLFTVDGRPVVFIWISRAFRGDFEAACAKARQRSSFYCVGSEFIVPFSERDGWVKIVRGMDAVSSYGFYDWNKYGKQMPDEFLKDYPVAARDLSRWLSANSPKTKILLPMGFRYDESRIPGRPGWFFDSTLDQDREFCKIVRGLIGECG